MQYEIDVTDEDIREGVPGSTCLCPVARAVCRTVGILGDIRVGTVSVFISYHRVGKLPDVVSDFIQDFDLHRPVHPIRFRLSINPRKE